MQLTDQLANKTFLAKGKRGIVFTAVWKGKKICIKQKNPQSQASFRIEHEAKMLKRVNKLGIGPRLMYGSEDELIMQYINGTPILAFIADAHTDQIILILKDVLLQCYTLDRHHLQKEEMHHPVKHVLVIHNQKSMKPVLIDFERCHVALRPKNVTQFCQFLRSRNVTSLLNQKQITLHQEQFFTLTKAYAHEPTKKNLTLLLNLFSIKFQNRS